MRFVAGIMVLLGLETARADLHFPQKEIHLGDVYRGRPLRHRFTFTNSGSRPVHVRQLRATCGCMTPRLEKLVYQPGESGSFTLEVNTLTQPAGPNRWRVQVHLGEADSERIQDLYLQATLRSEINVEPPILALSTAGPISHEVIVTDLRARPLRITRTAMTSPQVTASLSSSEGARQRIRVDVKEALLAGTHEEILSIFTDDALYPELRVPVRIVKQSRTAVTAAPANVHLTLPRGQGGSRVVLLRGEADAPVLVERIETDNPAISGRWKEGPGKLTTLRLSVDGSKVADTLRGTVRVHLRSPSPAVVCIPVTCTAR